MSILRVGIADPEEMKSRTQRIARGEERPRTGEPTVWFASTMSFAKLLSPANCELLRLIREQEPESLEELAQITGRAKSNLSRTLKTMAACGLVRMEKGKGLRLVPRLIHDRVELVLPLVERRKTKGTRK
ncbi:helix-turn-helix domain-containing protein [Shinella daejeonensis]|nr:MULTISPECIES: helix-turn-helix domain-containing protein [Hyphomicrobiales]MCP8897539.1 helix-turn-helix domain-containing protein [Shinella daejeonensis]HWJ88075.1 helix-turn-helix domain-containing protein [Pelagibacterium sp.]